jgi:hypothetical protein
MADKIPNMDYVVKPTLKGSEVTDAGKKFDKNLNATLARNDVELTEEEQMIQEIDKDLDQSQGSIKKKIWDLSKMESLVHSDPKLEAIYQDMEHEAEENQRYGYHWNEAVLNIMFNDYVLNSLKYLQKYKMAIPSQKKRRDKSGIKDLQRQGAQQMKKQDPISPIKKPAGIPEGNIHNNSLEGVIEEQYKLMENWAGDLSDEPNVQPVDQSNQNDHLQHRIERKYNTMDNMNEHHLETREEKEKFIYKHKPQLVMGQVKSLSDEAIEQLYHDIEVELGMVELDKPQLEPQSPVDAQLGESESLDIANQENENAEDINETTSAGGSAGPSGGPSRASGYEYVGPFGKPQKKKGINTSFWEGGEMVSESNYLTDPLLMENIYIKLNEDIFIEEGMDSPNDDSRVPIAEKSKSKSQQRFMGMVHAAQKGELDNPSPAVKKAASPMTDKDAEDFASTKHKGLPERVPTDEGLAGKAIGGGLGAVAGMRTGVGAGTGASVGSAIGDKIQNKFTNETMANDRESDPTTMAKTMKDVPSGMMGGTSMGGGMFENDDVNENVATRIKCNNDEEPVKGKRINEPGGCKKKTTLEVSPEDKKRNPHNVKSRIERIKKQEKDVERKKKEQIMDLEKSKKELAEQKALFESILNEDKKPASIVNVERLGKQNEKNFNKDLASSTVKDVVDTQDELSAMAQIEAVPENPYELGEKIETEKMKENDMKALENEGDSTNDDNKHIPKRNLTNDENDQIALMRNGLHSTVYDNKPSDRFEERMKRDMGDEIYELRQKQMEFKGKAPMYNKDAAPVEDTEVETEQFNKFKKGYVSQFDEGYVVTGKYKNEFGKNVYVNFKLNEVKEINKTDESYIALNMDGLGNRYTTKIELSETFEKSVKLTNFYIKEGKIYSVVPQNLINESQKNENKKVNEGFEKFKKLSGYDPNKFVDTKHARNILK